MKIAPNVIVVGVDGSEDARAALVWAAHLVPTGDGELHVVHVVAPSVPLHEAQTRRIDAVDAVDAAPSGIATGVADRVNGWIEAAGLSGPTIRVHLVVGGRARALADIAEEIGGHIIVVGAHGHSRRRPKMVGGVIHTLLHDSDLPVAVVRAGETPQLAPGNAVVVGVGSGSATSAALAWAVSFAAARGLRLTLVHGATYQPRPVFNVEHAMKKALEKAAYLIDPEQLREWADDDLRKLADDIRTQSDTGPVEIRTEALLGRPGPALVAASADAAMLVVGKHFDSVVTGYFTTLTLHHVLTHATCPVVVVPRPEIDS
jgi:nucleotide-binding universal stress UspA family protein